MKTKLIQKLLLCFLFIGFAASLSAQSTNKKKGKVTITAEELTDKIRGGMLGQIIGVINGLPHEAKYDKNPGVLDKYTPEMLNGAYSDDDVDFEWVYAFEMQHKRMVYLPYPDIKQFWIERVNDRMWWANRYARYLMDLGLEPPYTGSVALNPFAEFNVAGQFLCETYGLMALGMPQTAAKLGTYYTKVSIDYEPAQATQMFTTMIAMALLERDLDKILDAGVAALDPKSVLLKITNDVREIHKQNPNDWQTARKLFREKYYRTELGGFRNGGGVEINTGAIILAYLYGKGDFAETMRLSFIMGWDADCNAATIATILGVRDGYRNMMAKGWKIVDRFENRTREKMPMDETITSFSDRVVEAFELVNEKNGGKRTVENNRIVYKINTEQPANVLKLLSIDETRKDLAVKLKKTIIKDLTKGNNKDKARAAYLGICLELADELKVAYPTQWKEACYQMDGFWKIRAGIYSRDFEGSLALRAKFEKEGIRNLPVKPLDKEIYTDREPWRKPEILNAPITPVVQ